MIYGTETRNPDAKRVYIYMGGALGYVAWHIYMKSDQHPDALVSEFSEAAIPILLDYAREVPTYDEAYVNRVYDYILSNHRIEGEHELGMPIDLEEVRQHVRL